MVSVVGAANVGSITRTVQADSAEFSDKVGSYDWGQFIFDVTSGVVTGSGFNAYVHPNIFGGGSQTIPSASSGGFNPSAGNVPSTLIYNPNPPGSSSSSPPQQTGLSAEDILNGVGTVLQAAGTLSAAEDAEDAFHQQAAIERAAAEQARIVAEFNAAIYTANAIRLRGEMVDRLNEVAGVNIDRLDEALVTNVGRVDTDRDTDLDRTSAARDLNIVRLGEALGIGTGRIQQVSAKDRGRLSDDFERLAEELGLDATRDIGRIKEIVAETVSRLGKRAGDVATTGFEIENDLREQISQDVSSQRSFYAAGNIIVNTGTPMRLQLDSYQQGEIKAQRIRRDYKILVRDLKDTASDNLRTALFQIEDIRTETSRRFEEGFRIAERGTEDINITAAFNLSDLYRQTDIAIEDTNILTDYRLADIDLHADRTVTDLDLATTQVIDDIDRNLGYDISDTNFNAVQLDQQATLTIMAGEAGVIAGENRAGALEQAGEDVFTAGLYDSAGTIIRFAGDVIK